MLGNPQQLSTWRKLDQQSSLVPGQDIDKQNLPGSYHRPTGIYVIFFDECSDWQRDVRFHFSYNFTMSAIFTWRTAGHD